MASFADVSTEQKSSATVLYSLSQQVGMSLGVAVGALMLSLSQAIRGASSLGLFDFKIALVLSGALCALAFWPYSSLARDVGREISGHPPKPARAAA
jgi:hypothetical protein